MIFYFFQLFLFLITTIALANIIGKAGLVFLNLKPSGKFFRLFVEMVLGILLIVVIYSIIRTHFFTVNILFVFLFLFYLFFISKNKIKFINYKNLPQKFTSFHKDIIIIIIACLPFFLYELFFIYTSSVIKLPDDDYFFYSKISDSLNYFGKENKFVTLNYLYPNKFNGLQPYHYFELWINAFISWVFRLSSTYSLLLITFPLINTAVFLGLAAFWESFSKTTVFSFFFIFLFLFAGGTWFAFYKINLLDFITPIESSPFTLYGKKLTVIYLFFILFTLLFIKNKKKSAFTVLACLPIINISIMPAVVGGSIVYLFLNRFHKNFSFKERNQLLILFVLITVFYYILYFVIGKTTYSNSYVAENNLLKKIITDYTNINNYKFLYGTIVYRFKRTLIFYLPFIIFSFFILKSVIKNNKDILQIIILVLLFNFIGLCVSSLAAGLMDDTQLLSNTLAFSNSIIIMVLIYGLCIYKTISKVIKKIFVLSYTLILVLICNNIIYCIKDNNSTCLSKYSENYTEQIKTQTKDYPFLLAAGLFSKNNYNEINFAWVFRKSPGNIIRLSHGYRDVININSFLANNSSYPMDNFDKFYLENSEFTLFINEQKGNKQFISYEQSQIDFLDKFKIKFVFANKDAVMSELLKNKIDKEIVDSKSGERFYILK